MNEQSPLVPQGSLVEQKNKGRARVKIAVFFVLAVHGIGLLALLMQGCQKEPTGNTQTEATNSPAPPVFVETTNPPPTTNQAAAPLVQPQTPENVTPQAPLAGTIAQDYKVTKGDNFTTIGRKFGVTVKEIAAANPGVESSKLQVGETLHIPAPTKAAVTTATPTTQPAANGSANGEQLYSVVSGDNLTKIATKYGTTVKALRSANSLTTDSIKVGQKLKIPVKATASTSNAAGAVEQVATNPMTVPGTGTTVR